MIIDFCMQSENTDFKMDSYFSVLESKCKESAKDTMTGSALIEPRSKRSVFGGLYQTSSKFALHICLPVVWWSDCATQFFFRNQNPNCSEY